MFLQPPDVHISRGGHVGYGERVTSGHQAGRGKPCDPIAWADIKAGAEAKEVDWADVVDFYARHSCDDYTFFRGYRLATRPLERLPVLPPRR